MIVNQNGGAAPGAPPEAPYEPRRGTLRAVATGVLLGVLGFGSFYFKLPLLTLGPGPAPSVSQLIEVDAEGPASKGSFHITTVCVEDATLVRALQGWASSTTSVIQRGALYPPGKSDEEIAKETLAQMDQSKIDATLAALKEVGYVAEFDGALIQYTQDGTPAASSLESGDVIVAIDGKPVLRRDQVGEQLGAHKPGDEVTIKFRRGEESKEVTIKTIRSRDEALKPIIGVAITQHYQLPVDVSIDSGNIGGPSAGFMFAVGIVDQLISDDLTRGYTIAGSGTIDDQGAVGNVGGVAQKVEAARRLGAAYFFAPEGEAAEARGAAPSSMKVVAVKDLHRAVEVLKRLKAAPETSGKPRKARNSC